MRRSGKDQRLGSDGSEDKGRDRAKALPRNDATDHAREAGTVHSREVAEAVQ